MLLRFCVLALGSLLIGVGVALACAFVLKRLEALGPLQAAAAPSTASISSAGGAAAPAAAGRDSSTSFEIAVVVMGSYFSYLLAETAGMSGIVALFFSGICHSHYSYYYHYYFPPTPTLSAGHAAPLFRVCLLPVRDVCLCISGAPGGHDAARL